MGTQQGSQGLGLSQWFPSHMFPQEGSSSRAPEAWQEAEEHKEQHRTGTDRGNCKTKGESHENLTGTEAEPQSEPGAGIFPSPPPHIPPCKLREIEAELICADEAGSEFEFGELASPGASPAAHQAPAGSAGDSPWHGVDARLRLPLREGSARYRQQQFAAAAAKFSTALELCSRGFATEDPLKSSPDDISRVASFIEAKLVICYLKLGQPDIALSHSHRSIIQNPSHFRNHLLQAACFRCLQRYSEAARSAMIADCLYVLAGGTDLETSDLIQLYWQALIQEALSGEVSFSVLYTPFDKEDEADKIKEANKSFAEKHPDYVQHIFTDPHGIHLLPERAEALPDQEYLLTLGFRDKEIGKTVEKSVIRKLPICPGQKTAFSPSTEEERETFWENTGKKVMAVIDFIGSTKIKDKRSPCARAMEHFQRASLLGSLQRGEQQAQGMAQVMAELATIPYLQRVSQEDDKLLQSLTADAMDVLAGRTRDRVWTKIQKVARIEEDLREGEEDFLRDRRVQTPGMENMNWTPMGQEYLGQEYLRLENTNMFIPDPRSLATESKKRCTDFGNS
ncbi:spermatogenesis-associated protein 16-like [Neopelma chrysocephalum]|uniref:spermatogenesis-associated protein 16-like n=1 Tax=Neopelma chrysocephalum TaxID=114329 RepID=UPI000FCD266F|nr:spermatogenesis-associated protein 16-like [Neopelma chrysocephalum]